MILVGNQRGGAYDLAHHLMKDENEHVEVHELRGFVSDDLHGAFQEAYAISNATKCKQFLFSLSLSPPPDVEVPTQDFEAANLPEAFSEWYFTGTTEDHEMPCEICEMCGQQDLRYHFQIQNEYTSHQLNVGSHCILRFDVPVYENGERLSEAETKKYLDKLTKQMQLESCVRALERLATQENNQILSGALDYYKRNKKLTPKQAFVVFWRLRKNSIEHHPSFFSINLKKQRFVEDLRNMNTSQVHFFWSALSSQQKKKAIEMGHSAP